MINWPRWEVVRDGLKCAGFFLLLVIGLQASYLLTQAGKVLSTVEAGSQLTSFQAQNTLLYAQAVLSSTRQTAEIVRRSAEQEMEYYEASRERLPQQSLVFGTIVGSIVFQHAKARTRSEGGLSPFMTSRGGGCASQSTLCWKNQAKEIRRI